MYDFPFRSTFLAPTDSVRVSFDTVSQDAGGVPALEEYDILIFGNSQIQVMEQGKPVAKGRIFGAAGFGTSPNSATKHVLVELQVPLTPGPPTAYSPDPLFWSATVPPIPPSPPPPPPPPPCPTDPGKTYNRCVKAELNNAQATAADMAAALGLAGGLCSTVGALACGPLEPGLLALAAVWAIASAEFGRRLGADPPGVNFTVPPDSNFTAIATPATYTLTFPTAGLTAQEAAAFKAFAANAQLLIAFEQAATTSLARVEGASLAGNQLWVTNQMLAARGFGGAAGALASEWPVLLGNIGASIQAAGTQFTFTPNDVLTFLKAISPNSPNSEVKQQFALAQQLIAQQLGATSADQTLILELLAAIDPQAAGTLGVGVFPQALSDAVISTTFQQLGLQLVQNAPSPTSLTPSFQITLPGDYAAAGVGLRGNTSGTIHITGIPANATVVQAFLYWGMLDNGLEPSLGQLSLNSTPVTGIVIGSGPDTCWGRSNSFTFRADVTSLVKGNGAYALTGVASGGNILGEGASLVVIYQLDGAPVKTVLLDDGNLSMPLGTSSGTASFTGFSARAPVSAQTTFMVGDGQAVQFGHQTPTVFTGNAGALSFPNLFNSLDGPLWDTDTFNVSSVILPGKSTDAATIQIAGDCLLWSAQAFSVTSTPVTTPITATAALVQANSSGDTVTSGRGLNPGDAPTIQDQISFVVQSRIIQNPSTSGPDLTHQLVNGLVIDRIVSPEDANSIETFVLQKLVTPPGQPAISGKAPIATLTASANVELDVHLTDTGSGNAVNTTLAQITLKTLAGSGTVTLNTPALPVAIGNLAVGASATVKLFLNVPSTVQRFAITETGAVQDVLNRPFKYSTSQTVFVK
jgi:hypothetical protein